LARLSQRRRGPTACDHEMVESVVGFGEIANGASRFTPA
jgi:hypothetical protein